MAAEPSLIVEKGDGEEVKGGPAWDLDWAVISGDVANMDPDDPNYQHFKTLKKLENARVTLPPGWRKNPDFGSKAHVAPYIHEDGRETWKNPATDQMMAIVEAVQKEENAKMFQEEEDTAKDEESMSNSNRNTNSNKRTLSEHAQRVFLKKYRRMIKSGIPLKAVANTARLDGVDPAIFEWNPELIVGDDGKEVVLSPLPLINDKKNRSVLKYRRMVKSGVPLPAIQSMVQRELGITDNDVDDFMSNLVSAANTSSKEEQDKPVVYFQPAKNGKEVEFPLGSVGRESHLTLLVRKMVLTVKRGNVGATTGGGSTLKVEINDLYNALGALRGVQVARNMYNATCSSSTTTTTTTSTQTNMSQSEVRSKRKPYLELIGSLGIRSPTRHKDTVDIKGLDQLVNYIEHQFKDDLKQIQDSVSVGMYDFQSLSEIYKPGSRVVAKNVFASGVDMICEVSWNRYEQGRTLFGISRYFKVCFQFIVAVGNHFTLCEFVEGMESFEGRRDIQAMNFVPLSVYDPDTAEQIKTTFRQRGQMYARVATGSNFMAYDKGSFYAKGGRNAGSDRTAALRTSGRVMVDTQGSYEAGHSLGISSNDLMVTGIKYKYKEYMLHMRALKQAKSDADNVATPLADDDGMVLFNAIPDDYLEMTWPAVIGFSFTSKTWGEVLVDGLSDIQFDESVFDKIVLPQARKRMIKALVRHSNDAFNDIISGKGEGSVFLLYGPPGCGKTLTAEAMSEMLHRPLYSVSLGQLGVTPADLETKLSEILDLCSRWDALILLDEADIFLEKRSSAGSLERNATVSVMLRLVEYFKGVLFLTSNRVDALDPAFKTRITLALRYDPLGPPARKQVWINLLSFSGFETSLDDGTIQVDELSQHVLNGREIKNAIRVAMALAEEDGTPLSQDLLLETIQTLTDFNEKMEAMEAY